MPPLTTHLVIGERIFKKFTQLESLQPAYGAFLLGCLLVDVNGFSDIDRLVTHFGDEPLECCNNFLDNLDGLLVRPWANLENDEKAFALGYFCHLAADEEWKAGNRRIKATLGLKEWSNLIPVDVLLTEFDVLSNALYIDSSSVRKALGSAYVPDIFAHISQPQFQHMWDVAQIHVLNHSSLDTYTEMISLAGAFRREVDTVRQQHEQYRDKADQVIIENLGGVKSRTEAMLSHAAAKMPTFWSRFPLTPLPSPPPRARQRSPARTRGRKASDP